MCLLHRKVAQSELNLNVKLQEKFVLPSGQEIEKEDILLMPKVR